MKPKQKSLTIKKKVEDIEDKRSVLVQLNRDDYSCDEEMVFVAGLNVITY